jgi:hypothetical protein
MRQYDLWFTYEQKCLVKANAVPPPEIRLGSTIRIQGSSRGGIET